MSTPFDHEQTIPEGEHPLLSGRYRVVRRLGAGGMGEVHLVEDLKLDGRHFAVKLLPAFLAANKRAIAGLKREALHAMNLSHSHIVTVRGFEEMDTGQPFLVMDYVDGQTLEEILLERERMSEAEVTRIFGPIAEALDYAHGRGVIHRDVKPSNIMIRQDGTPLIMDFGIAREAKETSTLVTGRESTSGTLPYMSPEQLRGKKPEASQDIYSLAATMWECLAGEPPFSRGDLRHQIETVEPDPPSELDGIEFADSLLRGLSKAPEDRPESCGALLGETNRSRQANAQHQVPRCPSHRARSLGVERICWTLRARFESWRVRRKRHSKMANRFRRSTPQISSGRVTSWSPRKRTNPPGSGPMRLWFWSERLDSTKRFGRLVGYQRDFLAHERRWRTQTVGSAIRRDRILKSPIRHSRKSMHRAGRRSKDNWQVPRNSVTGSVRPRPWKKSSFEV